MRNKIKGVYLYSDKKNSMDHLKGRWRLKADKEGKVFERARVAVSAVVYKHRPELIAKLKELKTDRVSKLSPSDVCDFIEYAEKLKTK